MEKKFDIYAAITDRIITALKGGNIPWEKEWAGGMAYRNHFNNRPYSYLNGLLLAAQGGQPGTYASFKQWTEAGFKVKYGAKSKMVTFWKMLQKDKDEDGNPLTDKNGKQVSKTIPVLRYYNVFSEYDVTDAEGHDIPHSEAPAVEIPANSLDELLSKYYAAEGIKYTEVEGDRAFYRPSTDSITLPLRTQFKSVEGYYSTKAHESVHSTGAEKRLSRFESASFGDEKYAKEELVAEIGANFLLSLYGISTAKSERNTDAYCKSWARVLKDNPRWIVSAASKAEKAVTYIEEHQVAAEMPEEQVEPDEQDSMFDPEPVKTAKQDTVEYYVALSGGKFEKRTGKLDGDSGCVIEKRGNVYTATDYLSGQLACKAATKKELMEMLSKMIDKLSKVRTTDRYKAMCAKLSELEAA